MNDAVDEAIVGGGGLEKPAVDEIDPEHDERSNEGERRQERRTAGDLGRHATNDERDHERDEQTAEHDAEGGGRRSPGGEPVTHRPAQREAQPDRVASDVGVDDLVVDDLPA